jgi:hypothetical protein
LLLTSLLCALVLPAAAAGQDTAIGDNNGVPPSPLEQLLEQRAALNLTADQLSRLDGIKQHLSAENEPLVNQMMRLRSEWQQARRAARNDRGEATDRVERIRTEAEETRGRIQQNNRAAMQEVNRLLRPAQRKQLRGILQDRRQEKRGRRAGGNANGTGR